MKAGWEVKNLGDLCRIELGSTPFRKSPKLWDKERKTDNIWLSIADLPLGFREVVFKSKEHVSDEAVKKMKLVPKGTLMVSFKLSLGRLAFAGCDLRTNEAIAALHDLDAKQIERDYLYWFLTFFDWNAAARGDEKIKGKTLNKAKLKAIPIILPALEEQKRIVAVLDAAFEGLTRARAHIETNLQNARELFESSLEAALSDIASQTTDMTFGDPEIMQIVDGDRGVNYPKKSDFYPSGFCLFLSTKNVRPNGFEFDECMFVSKEKDAALRKGKLIRRDVLLTTRGTIGNIAIYDDSVEFDEIRINSGMLILRPNEERLLSEYLFEALRSRFVKDQIASLTSGAAQPQLPIKTLNEIVLPVPDTIELQQTVVGKLKTFAKQALELETHYRAKLQDLDDLRQSLLQNAFAGELT